METPDAVDGYVTGEAVTALWDQAHAVGVERLKKAYDDPAWMLLVATVDDEGRLSVERAHGLNVGQFEDHAAVTIAILQSFRDAVDDMIETASNFEYEPDSEEEST